ncbi:MAG: DUF6488 family protein [Thiomicrorhabdus sp.]|nr:DUF6488 family protein [Thiomicrorhabdus sp.]MCF6299493.1 DUF6488 family protein [Thiomicrorhabdus sp.]
MKTTLKTSLATAFVCASFFFSPPMMAGANHDHGHDDHGHSHAPEAINQETAKQKAKDIVRSLIEKNKVNQSWASITAHSAEKKPFNDRTEWVVIFNNNKITDADKQTLYIFLTLNGDYIAANHTGN